LSTIAPSWTPSEDQSITSATTAETEHTEQLTPIQRTVREGHKIEFSQVEPYSIPSTDPPRTTNAETKHTEQCTPVQYMVRKEVIVGTRKQSGRELKC
jgi:hypothetical protein